MTEKTLNLINRLTTADWICCECGDKYGKYSAGCSTFHEGICEVCGKRAAITETRDFGYLQRGICTEKLKIKGQSKEVAEYIASAEDYDDDQPASYELGEICLMLTTEEVGYLNQCLDVISGAGVDEDDTEVFVGLEKKIGELYCDYCIEYSLSPVIAAYYKKYGTYGVTSKEAEHFQKFKDNYDMLVELGFIAEGDNA